MRKVVRQLLVAAMLSMAGLSGVESVSAQAGNVPTITMDGKVQHVTWKVPNGVDITGQYQYMDQPGDVMVDLQAGGKGYWRGDTGEATRQISWWLGADASGKTLTQNAANGVAHLLIVEFSPGRYSGYELAIANSPRIVVINQDRMKAY